MRKFLAYIPVAVIALAGVAAVVPNQIKVVNLSWDPQNGIDAFKVYYSTNLAAPMFDTNGVPIWNLVTNAPGSNFNASVSIPAASAFIFITSSNMWGESSNSNVLSFPAAPLNAGNLKVQGVK